MILPDYTALVDTTRVMLHQSAQTQLRFRDEALFKSAYARPQNLIAYTDDNASPFAVAAALAHAIATQRPLVDGNKRAAAIAFSVTLLLNGHRLDVTQRQFATMFVDIAAKTATETDLERWGEQHATPDTRFLV